MIRHVVTWTFTVEDRVEKDRLALEITERLLALREEIPEIRSMALGRDVAGIERNADLLLDTAFDDLTGLHAYLEHPRHREVAAFIGARVRARSAIDIEV